MVKSAITARQQYWLDHVNAAQASGGSLIQYAEANDLKVKDLYQWKTSLIKRGHLEKPASGFVAVSSHRVSYSQIWCLAS